MLLYLKEFDKFAPKVLPMYISAFKNIIIESHEVIAGVKLVRRDFSFESNGRYVFVGVRQAGKSYLMYQRAKELIGQGHSLEEMVYVNFDDERLLGIKAQELDQMLQAYRSMFSHTPILFLDEIQNIDGWEHFVRRLANQKYMVYVSGSNAKMLSRDIATTLGGRFMETKVFPYSFREFLKSKDVELTESSQFGRQKGELERWLLQYFEWGGFPELGMFANKRQWLNMLYEKIILGDILLRNRIKNDFAFRLCIRRIADSLKTPLSYNRLANLVKATGTNTNVTTVMDYVGFCKDACLLFSFDNYAAKFVERATNKKYYFVDNGLLHIFLDDSETALMENICASTLYRKSVGSPEMEVYYYNKEVELDFFLPHSKRGIQVSYSVSNQATLEREIAALVKFNELYGLDHAEIVTYSEEKDIVVNGLTIHITPLLKWILANE